MTKIPTKKRNSNGLHEASPAPHARCGESHTLVDSYPAPGNTNILHCPSNVS
jgi:hypothetical protein